MREIEWLKDAEGELVDIVGYVLQNQGKSLAFKVYDDTISRIELLSEFPELGTAEKKYKFKGETLRVLHSWHTRVFYSIQETKIIVVLLWSNQMDEKALKRLLASRE